MKKRTLLSALSCALLLQEAVAQETPAQDASPAADMQAESAPAALATVPVQPAEEEVPATSRTSPSRPANRFIEEVLVTAQKREEKLQDVPISVQAFSADALDAKGIDDPKALQLATPGMQYNLFAGYSLIYIRGVGTDAFIPSADASVATYVDNVYYSFGHSLASSFGAVERVEVLKGPQGTLFGRNSTGGAINIVTKNPGPDPETSIQVSRSSFEQWNSRVYTNMPVTERFSISLAGIYNNQDNYYELVSSPRPELPKEITKGYRVKAGWTPIDELTAVVSATHLEVSGSNSMMLPATEVKPLGFLLGVREQPAYKTSVDTPVFINTTSNVFSGDVKYTTPWFDMRAIVAKQDVQSPALADYDGSNQPLVSFSSTGQFADVTTGEFQLLSNSESWMADRLNWIVGVYGIDSSAGYDPLFLNVGQSLFQKLSAPDPDSILGRILGEQNPLLTNLMSIPGIPALSTLLNTGVSLGLQGVLDTDSTAAFFQGTYNLTDELALTLGGRYQTEKRKLVKSTVNLASPSDYNNGQPGTRLITFAQQSRKTSNFAPKVVLDYKPEVGQMFYGSYSVGYKSGTFNIINIYTPTQYIEPEKVTAYEIGYKGDLLDGALRFNAAVFQNQIKNLQVQTISLTSGGAVKFETAGGARIRGAEFDATWLVLPETLPGLVVTAGGAYLDGKYTSYREGSGYDETTGLYFDGTIFPNRDFTGNKIVRTPKFSGNLGLGYTFNLGEGSLELAADVYHNSGFYYSAQNTSVAQEDAYDVVNARISYLYDPWNVRVTAFGKNINNAKYHYVMSELDFGTSALLAPDAVYGVRLNWDF